jgi:hypothetical protein
MYTAFNERQQTRGGNELDKPSKPKETDTQHDKATDKRDRCCNQIRRPFSRMSTIDMPNDVGNSQGHNGDGTDGHILGRGEELGEKFELNIFQEKRKRLTQ